MTDARAAVCGTESSSCVCVNTDCDGTHVCDCGGSWRGVLGDDFVLVRWPGGDAPSDDLERDAREFLEDPKIMAVFLSRLARNGGWI